MNLHSSWIPTGLRHAGDVHLRHLRQVVAVPLRRARRPVTEMRGPSADHDELGSGHDRNAGIPGSSVDHPQATRPATRPPTKRPARTASSVASAAGRSVTRMAADLVIGHGGARQDELTGCHPLVEPTNRDAVPGASPASCHSSIGRGVGPSSTSCGSTSSKRAAAPIHVGRTSLAATCCPRHESCRRPWVHQAARPRCWPIVRAGARPPTAGAGSWQA